jgi:hypothetical protein
MGLPQSCKLMMGVRFPSAVHQIWACGCGSLYSGTRKLAIAQPPWGYAGPIPVGSTKN